MATTARALWIGSEERARPGAKKMGKATLGHGCDWCHRQAAKVAYQVVILPERVAPATRFLLSGERS